MDRSIQACVLASKHRVRLVVVTREVLWHAGQFIVKQINDPKFSASVEVSMTVVEDFVGLVSRKSCSGSSREGVV